MGPLFVRSQPDPALLTDLRVLDNLLVSEAHHERRRVRDYMLSVQDRLTPNHRKIVTDWMLEVSFSDSVSLVKICLVLVNALNMYVCVSY